MVTFAPASPTRLKKVLGVAFGVSIVVGGTIGAGILRTPGAIAALLPDKGLILACWTLAGLYILLSASSYAELTTLLPKAGGAFNYIQRAFGAYAGFVAGWFDFLANGLAPAIFCLLLGEYTGLLVPALAGHPAAVGSAFLTLFTLLNLPGVRSGSAVQQLTSALKIGVLLVLVLGCFVARPAPAAPAPVLASGVGSGLVGGAAVVAFFRAMQLILGTYDGWMSVSFFAEEDDDPGRNIPRSYFIGALTVIGLYVLINAAILYVLPLAVVAHSPLAAAAAAAVAFGSWSATFMQVAAIFILLSILNAYMMIPARILYGLSREGYFVPQGLAVNRGGTPYFALLACYGLSLLALVSNSFEQLFSLGAVLMTLVSALAIAALLRLRKTEPTLYRPNRAWGYPYATVLTLLVTVVLFVGFAVSDGRSFLVVVAVFLAMYPLYRLSRRSK